MGISSFSIIGSVITIVALILVLYLLRKLVLFIR